MPFKSQAQRRFMYANYPKIAKRWSKHTSKNTKLPEYVEESYELKNTVISDGAHEATVFFTLTNAPGTELGLVYDLSNTEMPPDYVMGVIKSSNGMQSFEDPSEAADLLAKYGVNPEDVENEMYQQGVEQIEAELQLSGSDDGVRESLEFVKLFSKIVNS